MTCATCQRRPVRLSGRSTTCALCYHAGRYARAIETQIERLFRLSQQRRMVARRIAA